MLFNNTIACSPVNPFTGWVIGRNPPHTMTRRAINVGNIPGVPDFTYYNADFVTLGSYDACYQFLVDLYGPEYSHM